MDEQPIVVRIITYTLFAAACALLGFAGWAAYVYEMIPTIIEEPIVVSKPFKVEMIKTEYVATSTENIPATDATTTH